MATGGRNAENRIQILGSNEIGEKNGSNHYKRCIKHHQRDGAFFLAAVFQKENKKGRGKGCGESKGKHPYSQKHRRRGQTYLRQRNRHKGRED